MDGERGFMVIYAHSPELNSVATEVRTGAMKVRMQQRHLKAIVGALRFRQRLISGDVYGTLGRAAIDAWEALPDVAQGAYPARRGDKGAVQLEVLKACRAIEDIVWHQKRPVQIFSASADGMLASELLSQSATKERHTRFVLLLCGRCIAR